MATKHATYKIYNGSDWDTYYFATSAAQVGESNSRKFVNPSKLTINGFYLFNKDTNNNYTDSKAITLRGTDIDRSASNTQNIDDALTAAENRIKLLEDAGAGSLVSPNGAGLMTPDDKANLDAMWELWNTDKNSKLVDTITEIVAIFNQYPQGSDLVTALAGKANLTGGNTFSGNQTFNNSVTVGDLHVNQGLFIEYIYPKAIYDTDATTSLYTKDQKWYYSTLGAAGKDAEIAVMSDLENYRNIFIQPGEPTNKTNLDIWLEVSGG